MMQHPTWEYLVTAGLGQAELNDLGAQGWELVGVSPDGTGYLKRLRLSFSEQVTLDQKCRYYEIWGLTVAEGDGGAGR